jgi:hypothetical protein
LWVREEGLLDIEHKRMERRTEHTKIFRETERTYRYTMENATFKYFEATPFIYYCEKIKQVN